MVPVVTFSCCWLLGMNSSAPKIGGRERGVGEVPGKAFPGSRAVNVSLGDWTLAGGSAGPVRLRGLSLRYRPADPITQCPVLSPAGPPACGERCCPGWHRGQRHEWCVGSFLCVLSQPARLWGTADSSVSTRPPPRAGWERPGRTTTKAPAGGATARNPAPTVDGNPPPPPALNVPPPCGMGTGAATPAGIKDEAVLLAGRLVASLQVSVNFGDCSPIEARPAPCNWGAGSVCVWRGGG